jgi:hypothetical protein
MLNKNDSVKFHNLVYRAVAIYSTASTTQQ